MTTIEIEFNSYVARSPLVIKDVFEREYDEGVLIFHTSKGIYRIKEEHILFMLERSQNES